MPNPSSRAPRRRSPHPPPRMRVALVVAVALVTSVLVAGSTGPAQAQVEQDHPLVRPDLADGFIVPAGETWEFDPDRRHHHPVTGNVVVKGTLVMRPNSSAITHTLIFTDIDESDFEGGGGTTPTAVEFPNDIGLWVQGAGALDIQGSTVVPWARSWQAGWAGDEVRAAPHRAEQLEELPTGRSGAGRGARGERPRIPHRAAQPDQERDHQGHRRRPCPHPDSLVRTADHQVRHDPTHGARRSPGSRTRTPTSPAATRSTSTTARARAGRSSRGSWSATRATAPSCPTAPTASPSTTPSPTTSWAPPTGGTHPRRQPGAPRERRHRLQRRGGRQDMGLGIPDPPLGRLRARRRRSTRPSSTRWRSGMQGGGKDNSGFFWPATAEGVWTFVNNRAHNNNAHGVFVWQNTGTPPRDQRIHRLLQHEVGGASTAPTTTPISTRTSSCGATACPSPRLPWGSGHRRRVRPRCGRASTPTAGGW